VKTAVFVLILLFLADAALSDPYLVYVPSSEEDQVEWYEVDGATWAEGPQSCEEDLSLRLPLAIAPTGEVSRPRVRACNSSGCSEWTDPITIYRSNLNMFKSVGDNHTGIKWYIEGFLYKTEGELEVE